MPTVTDFEIVLPLRVVPQPVPHIVKLGDCGACVLGGLLQMIDLGMVYRRFGRGGQEEPIDYYTMRQALYNARAIGMLDRVVVDIPLWVEIFHQAAMAFGPIVDYQAWFRRLVMGFDSGYYAIALVDTQKQGSLGRGPDHWVMLVGAREISPDGSGAVTQQVLVSCSATTTPTEEWVDLAEFLRFRGGYNILLARPT